MIEYPNSRHTAVLALALLLSWCAAGQGGETIAILDLPGSGVDPLQIDYPALPRLAGSHGVVAFASRAEDSRTQEKFDMHHLRFQLHNYLIFHGGKYWCIWSDGPPIEDEPTQEVRYATSSDGLTWSPSRPVTGTPPAPYAFIARGLWVHDGKLLALAAHFRGKGAFGKDKELRLEAYAWDESAGQWRFHAKLYDDAINNFPPRRLASGDWIVTRRDARFNVSMLIGGRRLDQWESFPVVAVGEVPGFRPDEPIFWQLADGTLNALFRDNGGSQRLFHATSADQGRSWTRPALTNFPNSSSKLFALSTSRGYHVLVANSHPRAGRRELHLSISEDGRTFTRMAQLDIPTPPVAAGLESIGRKFASGIASLQYPHVIEQDEYLFIAFSRGKKQTEVFRVPLAAIDKLRPSPK